MKKIKGIHLLIAVLLILQAYSIVQIRDLKARSQQMEQQITAAQMNVESRIQDIYSNVNSQLAAKASLMASCDYEVGKLDTKTFTVPVTFRLQPKALSETTEAFLQFGQEKLPMEKKGTIFILTKNFTVMDEPFPAVLLEDKGVQQFEENYNLNVYSIKQHVFSQLDPCFQGEYRCINLQEPYNYQMKGVITTGSSTFNADNRFKNIQYILTLEGETVKTYDLPSDGGSVEINETVKLEKGQTLLGKMVAVDELNFTHEYLVMHYVAGKGERRDPCDENEKITAPDGTVVYEFDENTY